MRTIALRFANKFAPEIGTIAAHEEMIGKYGYVWYGKLGNKVSAKVMQEIMENADPKFLLIHSGATGRYWAYIDKVQHEVPELEKVPTYYRDMAEKFNTWFRVTRFEDAPKNILSQCFVASSGAPLSNVSRLSMSPYFIIDYKGE